MNQILSVVLYPIFICNGNSHLTMAKKRRFTTQLIAKNILKKIFVSLFWSVILMITVTI